MHSTVTGFLKKCNIRWASKKSNEPGKQGHGLLIRLQNTFIAQSKRHIRPLGDMFWCIEFGQSALQLLWQAPFNESASMTLFGIMR